MRLKFENSLPALLQKGLNQFNFYVCVNRVPVAYPFGFVPR